MDTERIAAVARLAATLIASAATAIGLACDADAIYTAIAGVIALACFLWSWWSNNNVTDAAIEAQKLLDALKDDGVEVEIVDEKEEEE